MQAVKAQRACQQLQLILQDICSLSNMLVLLSSCSLALLSVLDSEKMQPSTAGAEDLTLKREIAAELFAHPSQVVGRATEDVNYWTGSANVPREQDFLFRPTLG